MTRYELARTAGHKVYFQSAFHGLWIALLVLGFLLFVNLNVSANFDLDVIITITCLSTPLIGALAAIGLNIFHDEYFYWQRALNENELEQLLVEAVLDEDLVMLSMDDNKVYIAFVNQVSDPTASERRWIGVIPVLSGYRTATRKVEFTVNYTSSLKNGARDSSAFDMDFTVVLPVSRILSCRKFDPSTYNRFRNTTGQAVNARE